MDQTQLKEMNRYTRLDTTLPRGVPVAKVVSYTKKYINTKRLIGAECHQSSFHGLSRDFYTYHLSKSEKKNYWKKVSDIIENPVHYTLKEFQNFLDAKKRGVPVYQEDFEYTTCWNLFDPATDIVIGEKI